MPSVITHAAVGLALATAFRPAKAPPRLFVLATLLPMAPDMDNWFFGAEGASPFSHRGASHSLAFAALVAGATVLLAFRGEARASGRRAAAFGLVLFAAVAFHGILDAFTDGGAGVMFLWPFDSERVFWPVRPIEVAPLTIGAFFTSWGWSVFQSELRWVWIPAGALVLLAEAVRRALPPRAPSPP